MPNKKSKFHKLSPSSLDHIHLNAGIYYFVQQKSEPKTIFLSMLIEWKSAHKFLALTINHLATNDILSAGELIISNNRIIAWCLKSGYYVDLLELKHRERSDELTKNTGLGAEKYFSYADWNDCDKELFKYYFSEKGCFNARSSEKLNHETISTPINELHKVIHQEAVKLNSCKDIATLWHDKHNRVHSSENVEPVTAASQFIAPVLAIDSYNKLLVESPLASSAKLITIKRPEELAVKMKEVNNERWAIPRSALFKSTNRDSVTTLTHDVTEEAPKRFWCCF